MEGCAWARPSARAGSTVVQARAQASTSGGCVGCNTAKSQVKAYPLNNGTACASDSLSCTKDACNGSGACLHTVYSGYCVISNKCWAKGQGSCK